MKNTAITFKAAKQNNEKLTMLTAYDYSTAKIIDEAGINGILVGDSLGMVCLGYEDTLSVTMEDIIHHTKAVSRGVKNTLVIPVMAHIGLTPQSINALGGFKVQGKNEDAARELIEAAKTVERAGAFAVVLECVPAKLAEIITKELSIPTIGIGAGDKCDGQILVYQDMLGMFNDFTPKFVKKYANVGEIMNCAFKKYINEVRDGVFPEEVHSFKISDEVIEKLY